MLALRTLRLAIRAEDLRRRTGINKIGFSGRKINIGFKKEKIEGALSLGDVSSDIYRSWERMGFEDERSSGPVWGFMLKFKW